MGCQGCRGFVAFILKLLNFVQAFIGVAMILYAIWMLNHWKSHVPNPPSPIAPTPSDDLPAEFMMNGLSVGQLEVPLSNPRFITGTDQQLPFRKALHNPSSLTNGVNISHQKPPVPWFIYIFLGIGIIVCLITFIGHIAAEITNGCCLCCYSVLVIFLLLIEAALVGDIFLNHHWEKDIPNDPTGEFENIKKFIEDNVDVCKWVGLSIVIIQAFSLLLAMILRAMVSTRQTDYDSDEDYLVPRSNNRQPLLKHQTSQSPSVSATGETRPNRVDAWSKRMREKYGLNTSDFTYDLSDPKTSAPNTTPDEDTQRRCIIM